MTKLIEESALGLYCRPGDFYVDPWKPVPRAVITHAHGDHARWGSHSYLTALPGKAILQKRMGPNAQIEGLPYGAKQRIGDVDVSFHPAGHLLGSAQVRIEQGGEVTVVSGDYKVQADPTCAPFEPIRCHTFFTESTFALPIYRWKNEREVISEIESWWRANQASGRTSLLFAYALGKAQRILSEIDSSLGPILVHGAVSPINALYREAGVSLPATQPADLENAKATLGKALVIAPPSARGNAWVRKFHPSSTAFASGWMQLRGPRRRRALDRGFALSDHADWNGLLQTIKNTGAEEVAVMHGQTHALTRYLQEIGLKAWEVTPHHDEAAKTEEVEQPNDEEAP